jgi:hypothetical protein
MEQSAARAHKIFEFNKRDEVVFRGNFKWEVYLLRPSMEL